MKKILITVIALETLLLIVTGLFLLNLNNKNNQPKKAETGLNTNTSSFNKELSLLLSNKDFYKNIGTYHNLLNDNDYKNYTELENKLYDDKDAEDFIGLVTLAYIFEHNPTIKDSFLNLKGELQKKQTQFTEEQQKNNFEANNKCVQLISDLAEKMGENEKTEFIFYSEKLNDCIYVTRNKYITGSGFDKTGYDEFFVYKSSTQQKMDSYLIGYHYNYTYGGTADEKTETERNNKRKFIKFILENSNYSVDLIKDLKFYYTY